MIQITFAMIQITMWALNEKFGRGATWNKEDATITQIAYHSHRGHGTSLAGVLINRVIHNGKVWGTEIKRTLTEFYL